MSQEGIGLPRLMSGDTVAYRSVLRSEEGKVFLPGSRIIHGSGSRDVGNTGDTNILRSGILMGMDSTSKKFEPAYVGFLTAAASSGDLKLNIGTTAAAEVLRRIGASGDVKVIGPSGTFEHTGMTYVSTAHYTSLSSNLMVLSADGALRDFVVGSMIADSNGSHEPKAILPDGTGIKVTSGDLTSIDVQFPQVLVGGVLDESQLITHQGFSSEFGYGNTQIKNFLKAELRTYGIGFTFDGDFL